jgi:TRAP transporter 4TM/12TM fusion protein
MAPDSKLEETPLHLDKYEIQPRKLSHRRDLLIGVVAVGLSLFQLYTSWRGPFENLVQRSIHLAFVFTIVFAIYPLKREGVKRNQILLIDWILIVFSIICTIWVMINHVRFIENPAEISTADFAFGAIMTLIVLEGARRIIGPALSVMAIFFILYAIFGAYVPGSLGHQGFTLQTIIENLYTSPRGIWGFITGISASLIAGFLIFGSLLQKMGGGETFVDLSLKIAGKSHGGPAKVSCFSSAFFGTISGSAVANVVVDGVFNIPLMKGLGYKKEFAAAVEATASSGGQLVPPIMGAGAFVMAEILGIPYIRVAVAAAIPAALFYLGIYSSIHFEAQRMHLKPLASNMIPPWKKILPKSPSFFLPTSVLVYLLSVGYSPTLSVFYAIMVSIGWYLISSGNRSTLKIRLKHIIVALDLGGRTIVMVAALCACAQVVVCMLNMTGIGVKLCQMIINLGHGITFLTLLFGMCISLVLGMGIPTTAAYVLTASVVAPALMPMAPHPLAAHLFIFYYAVIAAITPPICGAVYVASAIAGSNWWRTAWIASRLGLSGFIAPLMFFYAPTLLCFGNPLDVIINSITASLGIIALSAAVMGFLLKEISWIERLLLLSAAFLTINPGLMTDIIGLLIMVAVYVEQKLRQEKGADTK